MIKVKDYPKWKSDFDASVDMRKASGEKSYQIFKTVDDPNSLVLLMEYDTRENLLKFGQSEELREAMQRSGVIEHPASYALEEVEKG